MLTSTQPKLVLAERALIAEGPCAPRLLKYTVPMCSHASARGVTRAMFLATSAECLDRSPVKFALIRSECKNQQNYRRQRGESELKILLRDGNVLGRCIVCKWVVVALFMSEHCFCGMMCCCSVPNIDSKKNTVVGTHVSNKGFSTWVRAPCSPSR